MTRLAWREREARKRTRTPELFQSRIASLTANRYGEVLRTVMRCPGQRAPRSTYASALVADAANEQVTNESTAITARGTARTVSHVDMPCRTKREARIMAAIDGASGSYFCNVSER